MFLTKVDKKRGYNQTQTTKSWYNVFMSYLKHDAKKVHSNEFLHFSKKKKMNFCIVIPQISCAKTSVN